MYCIQKPKLLPDETLASYVRRLAAMNCWDSPKAMLRNALEKSSLSYRYSDWLHSDYLMFAETVSMITGISLETIIAESTIMPCVWPLISRSMQVRKIQYMTSYRDVIPDIRMPRISSMHAVCPDCLKEDMDEYTVTYEHRIHQLPGISFCPKHGTQLIDSLTGKPMESTLNKATQNKITSSFGWFLNHWTDSSAEDLKTVIRNEINISFASSSSACAKRIVSEMQKFGTEKYSVRKMASFLSEVDHQSIAMEYAMLAISILFPDPQQLSEKLTAVHQNYKADLDMFFKTHTEYTSEGGYSSHVITAKHNVCGRIFHAHPYALLMGFGCPYCDKSADPLKLFQNVINNTAGSDYRIESSAVSMSHKASVKHTVCGRTMNVTPDAVIYHGRRCCCTQRIYRPQSYYRSLVSSTGNYTLLDEAASMADPVRIRCNDCGHVFTLQIRNFIISPYCRVCEDKADNEQNFRECIKDLTGDAYQLVGAYSHKSVKVTIKHTACGKTFTVIPEQFKRGSRCPYCHKPIVGENLKKFISDVSGGRYAFAGYQGRRLEVMDTKNGNIIGTTNMRLMQEFMRPTPSDMFPGIPVHDYIDYSAFVSTPDRIMQQVKLKFKPGSLIYSRDISISGLTSNGLNQMMRTTLCRRHQLVQLSRGVYCYPKDELRFTDKLKGGCHVE